MDYASMVYEVCDEKYVIRVHIWQWKGGLNIIINTRDVGIEASWDTMGVDQSISGV